MDPFQIQIHIFGFLIQSTYLVLDLKRTKINVHPNKSFGQDNFLLVSPDNFLLYMQIVSLV